MSYKYIIFSYFNPYNAVGSSTFTCWKNFPNDHKEVA